ncbi:MAG TPA: heavy metal translocating P-type ATPase, partial [Candidatus Cloacimonadota bacterium]|nr:heavy metal translocating P-type ATPase [Candidatus Cloacimonadota bacterium]
MKQEINIGIDGMHCAACSARAEKALAGIPGVSLAHVNLALEEASLEVDDKKFDPKAVEGVIKGLGFSLRGEATLSEDEQQLHARQAFKRMWITWAITLLIMILMLPMMLWGRHVISMQADLWLMFALSLLAMFFPARGVYVSAFKSVKSGAANMDVLIALGTISSLLVLPLSLFVKNIDGHAFTGIAGMILAFHLTGRFLEYRARGKASEAIRKLLNLGAKTALLLVDGIETEVPVHKIKLGDILIVKPGMKIPTDGTILEGNASIDESMATGESMPVSRKAGESVLGATLLLDGYIRIKTGKIGGDTFLAQVIKLVQQAQHSKVPIQVLADKITAIFVPVILLLAAVTFLLWMLLPGVMESLSAALATLLPFDPKYGGLGTALMATIAVLVIACPCALGLATPTALMVGSGIGANNGILIRNGEALQRMKDIRAIAFDKTGTLTFGKPELLDHQGLETDTQSILRLAASLEAASAHPLALAILSAAKAKGLDLIPVQDFVNISGQGIHGVLEGRKYLIGNRNFILSAGLEPPEEQRTDMKHATRIWLADQDRVLGIFYIADTLKPEAKDVVRDLRAMGIEPVMVSGDNLETAQAVADLCGITQLRANVLPQDKVEAVKDLRKQFGAVAMVGDGINDAPALKAADIGIAMGQGTDIAIEAADITIVRSDLRSLLKAINLSRATFRKIRQNLFWAFFYNLIAIPLAIMGL